MKQIISFVITTLFLAPSFAMNEHCALSLAQVKNLPTKIRQILVVEVIDGFHATMIPCEKQGNSWHNALYKKPFLAVIGKNGLVSSDDKKEGDFKTPAGLYPIGEAFGTKRLALNMDYRFITKEDKFVDDLESPEYNSWVVGKTSAKSYEEMLIEPYKLGAVVNYNMNPAIPGKGSAIFLHLWRNANKGTAGCVATDRAHLLATLKWLNKEMSPSIYIERKPVTTQVPSMNYGE